MWVKSALVCPDMLVSSLGGGEKKGKGRETLVHFLTYLAG